MRPRLRHRLLAAALLLAAVLACESGDNVVPEPAPPPVWSELDNLPSAVTLYALWAPRDDYIVGVGPRGNIWQWDGQRWTQVPGQTGEDLYAIDGDESGDAMVVGNHGAVLEQIQGTFVALASPAMDDLRGMWRSESGVTWVVGANGTILRRTGDTWSFDRPPVRTSLFGVWGSSDSNIVAVGVDGTILHHDGVEWTVMPSPTNEILAAVDGTAADDVWAVGAGGTVIHYNGAAWSRVDAGTGQLLQSVCAGCGPAVAGANGVVVRREGGTWSRTTIHGAPWLYAITGTGTGATEWTAGSDAILRYDGTLWSNMNRGTVPVLRSLTSSATDGLACAGDDGKVLLRGPNHWRMDDAGALQRLNAVWTASTGDIYAAGTNRIFRHDGQEWLEENNDLVEYFGLGESDGIIFAVGSAGAIRWRDGGNWNSIKLTAADLHAVAMNDSGGYIAGNSGTIIEYHAEGTFDVVYTNQSVNFRDIELVPAESFRAIAVGANGVSVGLSNEPGTSWVDIPTHVSTTLRALAPGPGGDLYAAGDNGTVLRLTDDEWSTLPPPTARDFRGACTRNGALFLCGGSEDTGGMVFRFGPPNP